MSGEMPYVWAAYIITWVAMAAYALTIMTRVRRAKEDLEDR